MSIANPAFHHGLLAENAFARVHPTAQTFVQQFSSYHFEAFTLGLQPHLNALNPESAEQMAAVGGVLRNVKKDPQFQQIAKSGGKNFAGPLAQRIDFVAQRVAEVLS